jgi:hypothetical protein
MDLRCPNRVKEIQICRENRAINSTEGASYQERLETFEQKMIQRLI